MLFSLLALNVTDSPLTLTNVNLFNSKLFNLIFSVFPNEIVNPKTLPNDVVSTKADKSKSFIIMKKNDNVWVESSP